MAYLGLQHIVNRLRDVIMILSLTRRDVIMISLRTRRKVLKRM